LYITCFITYDCEHNGDDLLKDMLASNLYSIRASAVIGTVMPTVRQATCTALELVLL